MGYKISIIGPVNIDLIIKGIAPSNVEELKKWVGPSDIFCITAGAAGYISQNLRKLGNEIKLATCIGEDPFGNIILNSLGKIGIDTTHVKIEKDTESGIALFILLFGDNKRPLIYRLPTHHGWPPQLNNFTRSYLLNTDLLHMAGYLHFSDLWTYDIPDLFKIAKKNGIKTSLDPQFPLTNIKPPWIRILKPLITNLDILLVDENEALNITGTNSVQNATEYLIKRGINIVAIKLGSKGVLVRDKKEQVYTLAIKPKRFIDTIGAGDAFDAGFLFAILKGYSINEASKMGVFAASRSIEGIGGTQNFPKEEEIEMARF